MDSELFTVGGVETQENKALDWTRHAKDISTKTANVNVVYYQTAKTLQSARAVIKVLYWTALIYLVYIMVVTIPMMKIIINDWDKSKFSQKEGLQYLGASTNVTRDDTGWPTTDSLAEASMRAQNAATAEQATLPTPPKATFVVPRERMSHPMTPEEALLKKQKQQ
jgi:hypothetical protein